MEKGRPYTGAKKRAPSKMKLDKTFQFCIDGTLVKETLEDLPKGVTIVGARVRLGTQFKRQRAVVPTKLRKSGCCYMCHVLPSTEAELAFDQVEAKTIIKASREVSKHIGCDADRAYFRYLTLSNGKSTGKFVRTTKEMRPDERDLRKKAVVLGLEDAEGQIQTLIADISANKYYCHKQTIEVTTILCSK